MTNIIYFRYHHWITIALLLRQRLNFVSTKTLFLTHKSVSHKLVELGLNRRVDFILLEDLPQFFSEQLGGVNFIIHHNDYAMNFFSALSNEYSGLFDKAVISFYADGFTNKFLKPEIAKNFISEISWAGKGFYITFDNEIDIAPPHLSGFKPLVCSSFDFDIIFNDSFFHNSVTFAYEKYSQKFRSEKLVMLLLRPWGSDKFQNGFFQSENIQLSQVICDMLDRQYGFENYDLLIRPDNRDIDYMNCVVDTIKKNISNNVNVLILDDYWVDWLTMDSFLHFLPDLHNGKVDLYVLDSTAASPFILRDKYDGIFVGVHEQGLSAMFGTGSANSQIKTKISSLKRMYAEMLETKDKVGLLVSHDDSFFSISKKS